MEDKILTIGRIEDIVSDGEVIGKLVVDNSGDAVKVKNPKGSGLKERWGELQVGRAYSFTMGVFVKSPTESFPFVKNFTAVEKELAEKIEKATKSTPKPIDYKTADIHNQVAFKIAGVEMAAQISAGRFPKATVTELAVNTGLLAKEILAVMEMKIEEV